ncbi:MAG TPA: hypothetical protein PKV44_00365 [Bacillota bacterium]|nr:hypothetical protein [Bacillota bacterium]
MMKKKDNAKKIAKEKTHPTADGNVMPTDAVTATSESSASVTSSLPDAIDSVTATAPDNAHDSTASSDDLSAFEDFTSIDNFEEITTTEPLSAVELQTVTELVNPTETPSDVTLPSTDAITSTAEFDIDIDVASDVMNEANVKHIKRKSKKKHDAIDEEDTTEPVEEVFPPLAPQPMELASHDITDLGTEDPDILFRETSTKKEDAYPAEKGTMLKLHPRAVFVFLTILAILVIGWSVWTVGHLNERLASPLTIKDEVISNDEFSFMYHYVLVENGVDVFKEGTEDMLKSPGENGFATYRDYFLDITAKEMQVTSILYDDAIAHGYSIQPSQRERAQAYLDWLQTKADAIGVDLDTYIRGTYGANVTQKLIVEVLAKRYFTEDYAANEKLTELQATDEQAEAAYQEAQNQYDLVSYRVLRIVFEQRDESFIATAHLHAQEIIEGIGHDESKFESVAAQFFSGEAKQTLLVPDSTLISNSRYADIDEEEWRAWVFDPARTPGDCTIFNDENGFPILFCFSSRTRQEEPLRNVRFFYMQKEDLEAGIPGVPTNELLPLAQTIYDGISDESSMITLETTYADQIMDGSMRSSQTSDTYRGKFDTTYDDWIFDPARVSGDKTMIEEENQVVIIYYCGASSHPEWFDRVNSFIRMNNYQAFLSEKQASYPYEFHENGLEYIDDVPS